MKLVGVRSLLYPLFMDTYNVATDCGLLIPHVHIGPDHAWTKPPNRNRSLDLPIKHATLSAIPSWTVVLLLQAAGMTGWSALYWTTDTVGTKLLGRFEASSESCRLLLGC
jgi:hypothetical protein